MTELVELGSGMASKTRALLYAMAGNGVLRRYVPFDVDPWVIERTAEELKELYPGLEVDGVVGDFTRDLSGVPDGSPRLVALLGGTIGNLKPDERAPFLEATRELLDEEDRFLLGTDLVKDVAVLEAAYNDSAGITAEFNRNLLRVLNRELGADFDPEAFAHVARWNAESEWIEMWLRSTAAQAVKVPELDLVVELGDGEEMRTEISAKFRRAGIEAELAAAGLALTHWWTDPAGDFALSLSTPV
jgi:L-histidine N-alpha-methyltransferase